VRKPPRRRQQEVLEAAARVFHEKGYESTSIQDIADEVGILKGSLYYYIRSKEDLLDEILQGVHRDALANIERLDGLESGALDQIHAFVTAHLTFNGENLTRMGVFFHDFRSLTDDRRAAIISARDVYDEKLRSLIRQGQGELTICADIDPKVAATAIMGMLNWIYQWYNPQGPHSIAELADRFSDFVVAGLACSQETHSPGHRAQLHPLPADFVPVA
jgi:TetR/AcrR family transcriptional regulator, cholesterol catabolism regulator